MKKNYNNLILIASLFMISFIGYTQNIRVSIINAQNTNDGSNDYYEADITIETIDGQADFKLGSGQLYFNYNTAAFGDNVSSNSRFEVTSDYSNGYFLGQASGFTDYYNISFINDNTTSRVSWAFDQGVSSGAMNELVTSTPKLMIHVKFTYVDVLEDPMVAFEVNEAEVASCLDQFFTACGPYDTATTTLDCSNSADPQNVNNQFLDATLDSAGAVLNDDDFSLLSNNISIYPNPASKEINISSNLDIINAKLYNLLGKQVLATNKTKAIKVNHLQQGVYLLKVTTIKGDLVKKIVIK